MLFLISPINTVSAQETPGHKLLYCFTQAKHRLQYLHLLSSVLTNQKMIVKIMYNLLPKKHLGKGFPNRDGNY